MKNVKLDCMDVSKILLSEPIMTLKLKIVLFVLSGHCLPQDQHNSLLLLSSF